MGWSAFVVGKFFSVIVLVGGKDAGLIYIYIYRNNPLQFYKYTPINSYGPATTPPTQFQNIKEVYW